MNLSTLLFARIVEVDAGALSLVLPPLLQLIGDNLGQLDRVNATLSTRRAVPAVEETRDVSRLNHDGLLVLLRLLVKCVWLRLTACFLLQHGPIVDTAQFELF